MDKSLIEESFETWWEAKGKKLIPLSLSIEEEAVVRKIAGIAWNNGAFIALANK